MQRVNEGNTSKSDHSEVNSSDKLKRQDSIGSIDWDFSESSSTAESPTPSGIQSPSLPTTPTYQKKNIERSPSIKFSNEDKVVRIPRKESVMNHPVSLTNYPYSQTTSLHKSSSFNDPDIIYMKTAPKDEDYGEDELDGGRNEDERWKPLHDNENRHDVNEDYAKERYANSLSSEKEPLNNNNNYPTIVEEKKEDLLKCDEGLSPSSPNGGSEKFETLSLSSLKRYASVTSLVSTTMDKFSSALPDKKSDVFKLQVFVGFLFLLIVFFVGAAHIAYYRHIGEVRLFGRVKLEENHGRIFIFNSKNLPILEAEIGVQFTHGVHPYPCIKTNGVGESHLGNDSEAFPFFKEEKGSEEICLEWKNRARLQMKKSLLKENMNCYSLYWQSLNEDVSPTDCFAVGGSHGHWYGGGETLGAAWPLDKGNIRNSPFVTGDEDSTEWGNVIKKFFLNSNGVSLSIEDHTPLFVSLNETKFCIQARFDNFAYYYHRFPLPRLNYTICVERDLKTVHSKLLPESFWEGHSQKDLDTLQHLLENPIWQLTSKNADIPISHDRIEKYIEEVLGRRKYVLDNDRGYLLLDHRWQKYMGDFEFDSDAFPNIKETINIIKKSGFRLVLTVNPYVSTESINFKVGVRKNIFVKERDSPKSVPALTWFDNIPSAALLDIMNNETVAWLQTRLEKLSRTLNNEVLFYLDIGNTFHVPTYFDFTVPLDNPDLYGEHFTRHVMDQVPVIGVSGASSKRPKAPAFVFLSSPPSNWSHLRTIIPKMLHLSVIGYPFVNPGPVGGIPSDPKKLVDFELFVRWWQLNTFLPMLHYFQPPTLYKLTKISKVTKKLKRIREEIVNPSLLKYSNGAMQTSLPVIRPLWMLNPNDTVSLSIDDQFMIGDSILVAPVLHGGQRKRDIYLPTGSEKTAIWMSGFNGGNFFKGGRWLRDVEAKLEDVMYFIRQINDTLPEF